MSRFDVTPAPTEEEAAAIAAALLASEGHGPGDEATPATPRWRLAARLRPAHPEIPSSGLSAWTRAARRYD